MRRTTVPVLGDTCWSLPETNLHMKNSNTGPGVGAVEHDDKSHPFDGDHQGRAERGESNGPEP